MKKGLTFVCCVMLLLVVPSLGYSQEDWGFQQGDWAFTLEGSGTSDDDVDNTNFSLETSLGYFMTDGFELGIRQGVGFVDVEGGDDAWNASTRGFVDYHFDLGRWRPFLGVNLGYLYGDNVNDTWIAGPEGGLKYFVSPTTFLLGMVEYNFTFEDADEADEAFDDGRFVYTLGFGIRF